MNRFAYYMSGYALKAFSGFSKARISIHGKENLPDGSIIFTANHFTRIETVLLPFHINNITGKPVWSLADAGLFKGGLKGALDSMGAVSTKDPHRDLLIVKSLITGDAEWIVFPEGMMVKNKKLVENGQFQFSDGTQIKRPHTGAATLALRTEFYRQRLKRMQKKNFKEFQRLEKLFEIEDIDKVLGKSTFIVPVNITYYPVRARENMLSRIALNMMEKPSQRVMDELMTEGTMILSGVDVDIRFGNAINIKEYFNNSFIEKDLNSVQRIEFDDRISSRSVMRKNSIEIMQKYMTSVYGMTTLNYDHIFASILRYLAWDSRGIDEYDFKCRAFLAATGHIPGVERYFHKSLDENQVHLLIDDKHQRFKDFIRTASDTGVVELKDGKIFRNHAKFLSESAFHYIRIENPVAVMANEVESLNQVRIFLKEIALKDSFEIKTLVKDRMIEKGQSDFENDYNKFFIKEESKPKQIGMPFLLNSQRSKTGVLLIHGYMAAPVEMKDFAQYLNEQGFIVYVPRLKGHGTAPEDLAHTKYGEWINCVEEGFVILRHMCDTVFVGGFSTGAGLALELQTRVEGVAAVFAVAPPMKLNDFGSHFVPAVNVWNQMMQKAHLKGITREFVANNSENPHINYLRNPIAGIRQLEKFMQSLEPNLKDIMVPVLVVQSRKDPVVSPAGTQKLFQRIGSEKKEYFLFDFDCHGIMLGHGATRVYRAIVDFLNTFC